MVTVTVPDESFDNDGVVWMIFLFILEQINFNEIYFLFKTTDSSHYRYLFLNYKQFVF